MERIAAVVEPGESDIKLSYRRVISRGHSVCSGWMVQCRIPWPAQTSSSWRRAGAKGAPLARRTRAAISGMPAQGEEPRAGRDLCHQTYLRAGQTGVQGCPWAQQQGRVGG